MNMSSISHQLPPNNNRKNRDQGHVDKNIREKEPRFAESTRKNAEYGYKSVT